MLGRIQLDGPGWPASASIGATRMLRCDPPDYRPVLLASTHPARSWADPIAALHWLSREQASDWYGFISYDLGRWFETLPTIARDDRNLPLFAFMSGEPIEPVRSTSSPAAQTLATPTVSRAEYESRVRRCLAYIAAGDVFQINLSQRFSVPTNESPATIYARLQATTPARYAAWLDFGDFQLLSNSPELYLDQSAQRRLMTRPIKGTRALRNAGPNDATSPIRAMDLNRAPTTERSPTMAMQHGIVEDRATKALENIQNLTPSQHVRHAFPRESSDPPTSFDEPFSMSIESLRQSSKDAAELNMIIDLERNDLGRVCEIGSVRVTQPRSIETHPTVVHGVATIEGQLRRESTFVDILRATFPGGSVTGAPKIRAMQIIETLEPFRRGPYCGAIGVIRPDGSHTFNLAIRTIVMRNGRADVQVGGGIVADSTPEDEYQETLVKARAMFEALGVIRIEKNADAD